MDAKLLLVKIITLLYREAQIGNPDTTSIPLVKELVNGIKTSNGLLSSEFGKDIITSLRESVLWMVENGPKHVYDREEILQRMRMNVNGDDAAYDALKQGIAKEYTEEELLIVIKSYRSSLMDYNNRIAVKEVLRQYNTRMAFNEETVNWKTIVEDLRTTLKPYEDALRGEVEAVHPSTVSAIDFSDVSSIRDILILAVDELDERGVLRFGWQGFNRMFGDSHGARRGEFVVIGALQHNFKSDWCLNTMRQVALYNKPYMRDSTKKPALLRVSFENTAAHDITSWYKEFYENETRTPINQKEIDPVEAAQVIFDRMQVNGYHILYRHIDPTEFTYRDFFDMLDKFEREGYEIHSIWCDYLNMMSKRGCAQGAHGQDIRDLFRRMRNYTSKRGITFFTPHQLSTEAKGLTRLGIDNFVKEIANKGYWDSCRTLDQEVDMEIYLHIETANGEKYLTAQRGKHRKLTQTRMVDMYTVYKFEPHGIIDDVNGPDLSRRAVGGRTMSEGGETAWYSAT